MPTLSICIPTYNRSQCLAELLDSIIAQGMPEIEVVVSDDASPDDTPAVAERYRKRLPGLRFIRQPVNIGLDRNFQAVVNAASGDYIWLMGDDDRLEPGGAGRVLASLDRWPGVVGLTVGVIDYDVTMRTPVGIRHMPETRLITGAGPVFAEIAELLGFISAMVVDRRRWQQASAHPSVKAMSNLYSQVYIVGRAIGPSGGWGVVKDACVGFRTSNDQFKTKVGWLERLKIDVRAYDEVADALFADDPATHAAMRRKIFESHIMARIVNAKTEPGQGGGALAAAIYLFGRYAAMPRYWTRALPLLIAPSAALRRARAAYKRYSRSSGTARSRTIAMTADMAAPAAGRAKA